MRTTYSAGGTTITILMQPSKISNLMIKLAHMPEVERIEEQPFAAYAVSSLRNRATALLGASIKSARRVLVLPKVSGQALEMAASAHN